MAILKWYSIIMTLALIIGLIRTAEDYSYVGIGLIIELPILFYLIVR